MIAVGTKNKLLDYYRPSNFKDFKYADFIYSLTSIKKVKFNYTLSWSTVKDSVITKFLEVH